MLFSNSFLQTLNEVIFYDCFEDKRQLPIPKINIDDKNDILVLSYDLPGTNKKELKISVANGKLSVEGVEGRYKGMSSNLKISDSYDCDTIEAEMTDGVLKINVKRVSKTKSYNVNIR